MGKRQYDFTVGNPGKSLILFSLPMMASSILQNLYNLADTIIVGRYVNEGALAAVSNCGTITLVLILLITGATQGLSIMISQFSGAKDEAKVKKAIWNGLILIVGVGIVCSLVGTIFTRQMLQLIQVPADILDDAVIYLRIVCSFLLATVLYNLAFSVSRSLGDSTTPMIVLAICCVVNIALNLLFVLQFDMGVAGVAYGLNPMLRHISPSVTMIGNSMVDTGRNAIDILMTVMNNKISMPISKLIPLKYEFGETFRPAGMEKK